MFHFNPDSCQLDVTLESSALEGGSLNDFREEIRTLPSREIHAVNVDLESVDQIDSCGLDALVDLRRHVDAGTTFALKNVRPNVEKVIALLGASSLFQIQSVN